MKFNLESIALKVLLFIFGIGVIIVGIYGLPSIANEVIVINPELAYAKLPTLIIGESLLALLLVGIIIIIYLLRLFDKKNTFTFKFVKGLEVLVIMCLLAFFEIFALYFYISSLGGPDLITFLAMVGTAVFVLILASVIMLIRAIVKNAITYKTDYDLTV